MEGNFRCFGIDIFAFCIQFFFLHWSKGYTRRNMGLATKLLEISIGYGFNLNFSKKQTKQLTKANIMSLTLSAVILNSWSQIMCYIQSTPFMSHCSCIITSALAVNRPFYNMQYIQSLRSLPIIEVLNKSSILCFRSSGPMTKQASNYFMPLSHCNLLGWRECAEHLRCLGNIKRELVTAPWTGGSL